MNAVENTWQISVLATSARARGKLNLIRFEFAHDRNFVYAYFLAYFPPPLAFLETCASRSLGVKTSLSCARSFTHVHADVKCKAYRISRERCPESAGVSCDARITVFLKTNRVNASTSFLRNNFS